MCSSDLRTNIANPNNVASHDSAVYDMNRDGYADILLLSYRSDSSISFGSANGTFTTYNNISSAPGVFPSGRGVEITYPPSVPISDRGRQASGIDLFILSEPSCPARIISI